MNGDYYNFASSPTGSPPVGVAVDGRKRISKEFKVMLVMEVEEEDEGPSEVKREREGGRDLYENGKYELFYQLYQPNGWC